VTLAIVSGDGRIVLTVVAYTMQKILVADAYLRGGFTDSRIHISHRSPRRS